MCSSLAQPKSRRHNRGTTEKNRLSQRKTNANNTFKELAQLAQPTRYLLLICKHTFRVSIESNLHHFIKELMTTTKYDSLAEELAFHNSLISDYGYTKTDTIFDTLCTDQQGTYFRWKADYAPSAKAPAWQPLIEFKKGSLNSRKEKLKADNEVSRQLQAGFMKKGRIVAEYAWANSKVKQAIVQKSLSPMKHLIVFQQIPTDKEARAYDKLNLFWCTLQSFPSCMAFIFFTSAGLKSSFHQYGKNYVLTRHNSI
jgi:hypothetical protein